MDSTTSDLAKRKGLGVGAGLRRPLREKLNLAFLAVTALPLIVLAIYLRFSVSRSLEQRTLASIGEYCAAISRDTEHFLRRAYQEITFLSEDNAVYDLGRARQTGDKKAIAFFRGRATETFMTFARHHNWNGQVRYIDENGREIVRVDSDGERIWEVPEGRLQDKSDRYYVKEALRLSPGQVYVSPLDLNRERGRIEQPLQPVIRYAAGVFVNGRRAGFVMTNVSAEGFLRELRAGLRADEGQMFLVDNRGYYLAHPDRSKEWGGPNDLATGSKLSDDYGRLAQEILRGRSGSVRARENFICYEPIFPDPVNRANFWVLLRSAPLHTVLAPARHFRFVLGAIFLVGLAVAFTASLYLSKRLSRPLQELRRGADLIGQGRLEHRVQVSTGDELEVVARAFNQMAERLEVARSEQALALVGRMASSIVHDLRNPLAAIKGFSDLLAQSPSAQERTEFSGIIRQETDRILSMIQDLLDFSRGRPGDLDLQPTDIGQFLLSLRPVLQNEADNSHIALFLNCPQGLRARMDARRFARVILNLAANAREAMGETGGRLTIEAKEDDGGVKIAVQDTGPGLPPGSASQIFEPFVTRGKRQGTGLGLAICRQIVEAHGGTIEADLSAPQGARFVIRLPLAGALEPLHP